MSPFLLSSHHYQLLVSTTKPGWEACRKSFGIFTFLPSRDITDLFPTNPSAFCTSAKGQALPQSPDTLHLSWERLFCSDAGHMVGPMQPLLLKQHLALLQEAPKLSSV